MLKRITLHRIPLDSFFALFDGFAPPPTEPQFGWTREDDAMLTRLWLQGVHVDDIRRVVNKPHRYVIYVRRQVLGLPARRKGIRRDAHTHTPLSRTQLASLHQELRRAM